MLLIPYLNQVNYQQFQDLYPNFSDPNKQLKFERKRIYINEVAEKEMILGGGGSKFNPLSLMNDIFADLDLPSQPTYTQNNLTTQYRYKRVRRCN